MTNINWFYNDEQSPSDELVDKFADSKFGIDKWSSFAREIIQNSLDATDNEDTPVEVIFDLNKNLTLTDIPGGDKIKEILERCINAATNKQTKGSYRKGLEILNNPFVYCLKISDKNTKGVKTGRDEAWGALVFDEGRSVKPRPGSAGSHGVGKKVPFIISTCNTVFYATKNKYEINGNIVSDCLMQGKTTLINWTDENNVRKSSKGWFGNLCNDADTKNRIQPIDATQDNGINEYFIRKDTYGTDVIIIGANVYDNESEVKKYIISAVLENFFIAILNKKLVVNVFGEILTDANFYDIASKYYFKQSDSKNDLFDCLSAYDSYINSKKDVLNRQNKKIGSVHIYLKLGNENNKKNYTVIRDHGMRITEYRVNTANQPYTAVVLVNGKELNALLSELENAAHDKFITEDENLDINPEAIDALGKVKNIVKQYILENTKIDEGQGQTIDGLGNIINIPGLISSIKKKTSTPSIKRNKSTRPGRPTKHPKPLTPSIPGPGPIPGPTPRPPRPKPGQHNDNAKQIIFEDFKTEPTFMKGSKSYTVVFEVNEDIVNADLVINSINSEGKTDNSIGNYIDTVYYNGQSRKCTNGTIANLKFAKGTINTIEIKLKKDITYQLSASIYIRKGKTND